jgi:hypothetical protein
MVMILSQDNRYLDRYSNQIPHECKSKELASLFDVTCINYEATSSNRILDCHNGGYEYFYILEYDGV